MKNEKHYDNVAVEYRTDIKGWVDTRGRYWGENEHMARWSSCETEGCATDGCNKTVSKSWKWCEDCKKKRAIEKWQSATKKAVSSEDTMYYSDYTEDYFQSWEDVEDYCEEHDCTWEDLLLYHCERESAPQVDVDQLYEDITPDGFYSSDMSNDEIDGLIDKLNDALSRHPVNCFNPTKVAVEI